MRLQVYRNLTRGAWSVRHVGRVIGHRPSVILRDCTMKVREVGRLAVLRSGHRSVYAWIEGESFDGAIGGPLIEIGYNPFLAATFTLRPGFEPVHEARFVVLGADGKAYAVL
jgi:hypothetical protein